MSSTRTQDIGLFSSRSLNLSKNPRVPRIPLFFAFVITPTLKSIHKTMIVDAYHGAGMKILVEINGLQMINNLRILGTGDHGIHGRIHARDF
jgi:hypothetical protein